MNTLPRLRIRESNPHLLATEAGDPFFLLGDTAWELFHRLTRAEADTYFADRAAKGFTLICAVVLAEFDGLRTPNAEGEVPLTDLDPLRPNEAYFELVDAMIASAAAHGLYIGLLPTWGDKLTGPWGDGPRIFPADRPDIAHDYGRLLAERYRDTTNLLWILGGDRPAFVQGVPDEFGVPHDVDWRPVWRAMAQGISEGTRGEALFGYHPQGGDPSTSPLLNDEPWLNLHAMQSGHGAGRDVPVWVNIERDYRLSPTRPTFDAEPNYEDHPVNPWPTYDPANGYFRDYDVRKQCYRSVFAGGCGVVYGHHAVWQFWDESREPINYVDRTWQEAIKRPGAFQMGYLRRLIESRPGVNDLPDQEMIASDPGTGATHARAIRDREGRYGLIYIPTAGQAVTVRMDNLRGARVRAAWFDPRLGRETGAIGEFDASGQQTFVTPTDAGIEAQDWVLTLDSV